jgi:small redox-active disulfide protein 2
MKKIKILGTGCPKCNLLAEATENAVKKMGIEYELEKVTDISEITKYGAMMTPALVVNEIVKSSGKVPDEEEIQSLINS